MDTVAYNPKFVCTADTDHFFASDVYALAVNDRLELAPCPTCGAVLQIASVIDSLIAHSQAAKPVHVDGLVVAFEHPGDASRRVFAEFVDRIA